MTEKDPSNPLDNLTAATGDVAVALRAAIAELVGLLDDAGVIARGAFTARMRAEEARLRGAGQDGGADMLAALFRE